jgi:hypothetical protein
MGEVCDCCHEPVFGHTNLCSIHFLLAFNVVKRRDVDGFFPQDSPDGLARLVLQGWINSDHHIMFKSVNIGLLVDPDEKISIFSLDFFCGLLINTFRPLIYSEDGALFQVREDGTASPNPELLYELLNILLKLPSDVSIMCPCGENVRNRCPWFVVLLCWSSHAFIDALSKLIQEKLTPSLGAVLVKLSWILHLLSTRASHCRRIRLLVVQKRSFASLLNFLEEITMGI